MVTLVYSFMRRLGQMGTDSTPNHGNGAKAMYVFEDALSFFPEMVHPTFIFGEYVNRSLKECKRSRSSDVFNAA